jgi:hypothetical protein
VPENSSLWLMTSTYLILVFHCFFPLQKVSEKMRKDVLILGIIMRGEIRIIWTGEYFTNPIS